MPRFASFALGLTLALGAFGATALLLAGCTTSSTGGGGDEGSEGGEIIVGTTDKITSLDPAGSYDNGSFAVMNQVYPFLLNSVYGTAEVTPDIAESAEFTSPGLIQSAYFQATFNGREICSFVAEVRAMLPRNVGQSAACDSRGVTGRSANRKIIALQTSLKEGIIDSFLRREEWV